MKKVIVVKSCLYCPYYFWNKPDSNTCKKMRKIINKKLINTEVIPKWCPLIDTITIYKGEVI